MDNIAKTPLRVGAESPARGLAALAFIYARLGVTIFFANRKPLARLSLPLAGLLRHILFINADVLILTHKERCLHPDSNYSSSLPYILGSCIAQDKC